MGAGVLRWGGGEVGCGERRHCQQVLHMFLNLKAIQVRGTLCLKQHFRVPLHNAVF